jgi:hypothetical protein
MRKAIGFLSAVFIINFIGMYYELYNIWWFDMVLHFLGGFFVAMLMVHYLDLNRLVQVKNNSKLKQYLIIVGATSFIGIIWEFAEYLASLTLIDPLYNHFKIRTYFIGDLDDTINDLLMDIVGAFSWLFLFRKN